MKFFKDISVCFLIQVQLECLDPRYEIEGNNTITCQLDKTWTPDVFPVCKRKTCDSDSGVLQFLDDNGTCKDCTKSEGTADRDVAAIMLNTLILILAHCAMHNSQRQLYYTDQLIILVLEYCMSSDTLLERCERSYYSYVICSMAISIDKLSKTS